MAVLRSYVGGAWTRPCDEGRPLLDASTGEEVARVSSDGLDLARRWPTGAAPAARRCAR